MTTDEKTTGKLKGRIALVTGGTSGIGLATAKRFVAEGAYVFITGRREKELAAAVKSIGERVTGVQGDVSQIGDLGRLFAQIDQEKGRLDIVFANAGDRKICAPRGDHRGVLRLNIRCQCERTALYRTKGIAIAQGRLFHCPLCVCGCQQGTAFEQRLQCYQGRRALIRPHVGDGSAESPHSRERREPRFHRYAWAQRTTGFLRDGTATVEDDLECSTARQARKAG